MSETNPFAFDERDPKLPAGALTRRPDTRQPWYRRRAAIAATTFTSVFVLIMYFGIRTARRQALQREYGPQLVGNWVFDGIPFDEKSEGWKMFDILMGVWHPLAISEIRGEHNRSGWSLELKEDGTALKKGQPFGRWRITDRDEDNWIHVDVECPPGVSNVRWKFKRVAAGKVLWEDTSRTFPVAVPLVERATQKREKQQQLKKTFDQFDQGRKEFERFRDDIRQKPKDFPLQK